LGNQLDDGAELFAQIGESEMTASSLMLGRWQDGGFLRLEEAIRAAYTQHPFFSGCMLMIVTAALWALAFAAPLAVPSASSIEIAMGRFVVYGLISASVFGFARFAALPSPLIRRALVYALTGNVVYYVLLVAGIRLGDATMAVLIIGMLPVTVAFAGRIGMPQGSLRTVAWPLMVFLVGIALFNAAKTDFFRDLGTLSLPGIICVTSSLVMWTWYAVSNAHFLQSTDEVSEKDWSSIVGIMSLGVAIIILPFSWVLGFARNPLLIDPSELGAIAIWSVVLGGGSTWLGTVLFNLASKKLETSILGQLIVFEAAFGILYVFVISDVAPSSWGLAGISIALVGVWLSVRAIQKP